MAHTNTKDNKPTLIPRGSLEMTGIHGVSRFLSGLQTDSTVLSFELTNVPAVVNNIYVQSHAKLVAEGYAKLRSGEMPSDAQLYAMGLNEPEARGMIVLSQMDNIDDAVEINTAWQGVNNLLDEMLLEELARSGEKYNPDDIVAISKTTEGKLVWLENGNESAGLKHIVVEHASDFMNQGISQEELPTYIMEALKSGRIVGYQGKRKRPIYEFSYKGSICRVAITVSANGFVIGANPK